MPNPTESSGSSGEKACPYCAHENYNVASECEVCHYRFFRMCPECGKPSWPGDHACKYCGKPFKKFCPRCGEGAPLDALKCVNSKCGFYFVPPEEDTGSGT